MNSPKSSLLSLLLGISLTTGTTLALEISLTRYFSITRNYHFAFLVVSLAFLGYGASGTFITFLRQKKQLTITSWPSWLCLFYSLAIFSCFFITNSLTFDLIELSWAPQKLFLFPFFFLLLAIPFFFSGAVVSLTISQFPGQISMIYFADLTGAALGVVSVLGLFSIWGDRGIFPSLMLLPLLASVLFASKNHKMVKILTGFIFILGVVLLWRQPSFCEFKISPYKPLSLALRYPQATILTTKWNAISRVDIIKSPAIRYAPGLNLFYEKELPPQLGIAIDGQEISALTSFTPTDKDEQLLNFLNHLPPSFVYSLISCPKVLLISPRAGLDLLLAVYHQAKEIKAIESNPLLLEILQTDLGDFYGHLYGQPRIKALNSNPRAGLSKIGSNFEIIAFPFTDVFGATSTGLYGFQENYLYTQESFRQAFNLLSPQGWIIQNFYLLPPPRQELRALATWLKVLKDKGLSPSDHLLSLRTWGTFSLFIKKSPISLQEIKFFKQFAAQNFFDLVYYPGIKPEEANQYNQFPENIYFQYTQHLISEEKESFIHDYLFNITPPSDNRPFFYNFFKWSKLKATYQAFGQKWLPFLQAEGLIPVVLIQVLILASFFILLPRRLLKFRTKDSSFSFFKTFAFFYLIGMSFMFVEITAIQKFILFMDHPVYSFASILIIILTSSGAGSLLSHRLEKKWSKKAKKIFMIILGFFEISYFFWLKILFTQGITLSSGVKLSLAWLTLLPLGVMMGFPFPTAIHQLKKLAPSSLPWAWAVNAFSSVINSVAAIFLAFFLGYNGVWVLGGLGYLGAAFFLDFTDHRNKADT